MKLAPEEKQMFDSLRESGTGKTLLKVIERLEGEICDVRNWSEQDTPESARLAAKHFRKLRDLLKPSFKGNPFDPNEYH
jgi:hypothetical protein